MSLTINTASTYTMMEGLEPYSGWKEKVYQILKSDDYKVKKIKLRLGKVIGFEMNISGKNYILSLGESNNYSVANLLKKDFQFSSHFILQEQFNNRTVSEGVEHSDKKLIEFIINFLRDYY